MRKLLERLEKSVVTCKWLHSTLDEDAIEGVRQLADGTYYEATVRHNNASGGPEYQWSVDYYSKTAEAPHGNRYWLAQRKGSGVTSSLDEALEAVHSLWSS